MRRTRVPQHVLCRAILLALAFAVVFDAQTSRATSSKVAPSQVQAEIFADGNLLGVESEAQEALKRLKSRPRSQVIAALRPLLQAKTEESVLVVALEVVLALDLTELKPEVIALAKTSDVWQLFVTLNRWGVGSEVETLKKVYVDRLDSEVRRRPAELSVVKVAILDGLASLKASIPIAVYGRLLELNGTPVLEATVRNFLDSRTSYSTEEQIVRFRKAFAVKRGHVRLMAMREFAALSADERKRLGSAIDHDLCKRETTSKAVEICGRILRGGP